MMYPTYLCVREITTYQGKLVRDAAVNRVLVGPRQVIDSLPLLQVAGHLPVLIPQFAIPSAQASPATSTHMPSAGGGNVAATATKPAKIPRPPNAFIIYRKAYHAEIVAKNPGLHNNQICMLVQHLLNEIRLTLCSGYYWPDVECRVSKSSCRIQGSSRKFEERAFATLSRLHLSAAEAF